MRVVEFDASSTNETAVPSQAAVTPQTDLPSQSSATNSLYTEQCANGHGNHGEGTLAGSALRVCRTCGDVDTLATYIELTMPLGKPKECDADCSQTDAAFILENFSSGGKPNEGQSNSNNGTTNPADSSAFDFPP